MTHYVSSGALSFVIFFYMWNFELTNLDKFLTSQFFRSQSRGTAAWMSPPRSTARSIQTTLLMLGATSGQEAQVTGFSCWISSVYKCLVEVCDGLLNRNDYDWCVLGNTREFPPLRNAYVTEHLEFTANWFSKQDYAASTKSLLITPMFV